jgi:hypothetical protein
MQHDAVSALWARRLLWLAVPGGPAKETSMSLGLILLIILILLLVGALPTWPHSTSWGYWPSGGIGVVVLVLVVLLLSGRL